MDGDVLIVGFAAFFLEGVGGSGNNNYVTGTFMQMVVPGDISTGETGIPKHRQALFW